MVLGFRWKHRSGASLNSSRVYGLRFGVKGDLRGAREYKGDMGITQARFHFLVHVILHYTLETLNPQP